MQLSESSGQDRKTTLMHYLLQQLHQHRPELLDLPNELESVSKSSESMLFMYDNYITFIAPLTIISVSITGISAELEGIMHPYIITNYLKPGFQLSVMQKELDKIERFANKIVEQSNLPQAAAKKLTRDVKVCMQLISVGQCGSVSGTLVQCVYLCIYQLD